MRTTSRFHAALATSLCLLSVLAVSRGAAQAPAPVAPATAPIQVEVRGAALYVGPADTVPRRLALPCEPVAQQRVVNDSGERLYLACAQRVLSLDVTAEGVAIADDVALPSAVESSHEASGHIWLELADGSARRMDAPSHEPAPLELAAPVPTPDAAPITPAAATAAATRIASAPPIAAVGRVTAIRQSDRAFVVNLGSADGIGPGVRLAVSSGDSEAGDAHVVIGRVRSTTDHTALVSLDYGEQVQVGQRVESAGRSSRTTPRRIGEWPYRLSIRADLRPSLVLDGVGANIAVEGEATLHRGIGIATLRLSSSGISFAKRSSDYSASSYDEDSGADFGFGGVYVLGGVDLGFVAISAGIGVERIYQDDVTHYDYDTGRRTTVSPAGYVAALTFPLRLRIGREDSIHGEVTQLVGYERSRLRWLGVEARLLVPAGPVWIFGEGYGGRMPAFHGTAGVRVALTGNGEPGSLLLNIGAGIAGVTSRNEADKERSGPAVQVGFEMRL